VHATHTPYAQGEFDLTFFQDGLLSPAFLVGLLIAAPLFAEVRAWALALRSKRQRRGPAQQQL